MLNFLINIMLIGFFLGGLQTSVAKAGPKVNVIVTVDWEGRDLRSPNLAAMQALRAEYPEVPLLHYLNAAYFTKPDADPVAIRSAINSVLLPIDQRGLHIHAWKTLITSAGVRFRNTPSLSKGDIPATDAECQYDCGHVIPLIAYSKAEITEIVRYSLDVLAQQGFGRPVHFRAGAWMLNQNGAEALTAGGIVTDSSAVPAQFLQELWGSMPLYPTVKALWPNTTPLSQPYQIATSNGPLFEVPDNGCLADYMTAAQMMSVIRENFDLATADGSVRTVVIGFHQETAEKYLPRIREFLGWVATLYAGTDDIQFTAMPGIGSL